MRNELQMSNSPYIHQGARASKRWVSDFLMKIYAHGCILRIPFKKH